MARAARSPVTARGAGCHRGSGTDRAYSGVNAGLGALTVAYAFATVTYSESMTLSAAPMSVVAGYAPG